MEITLLDSLLLLWAVLMTTRWLDARAALRHTKVILVAIMDNDALRERMVADYKKLFPR